MADDRKDLIQSRDCHSYSSRIPTPDWTIGGARYQCTQDNQTGEEGL